MIDYIVNLYTAAVQGGSGGEAPTDYTKLRQTMQSLDSLYKAPRHYTKPPKYYTKDMKYQKHPQKDYTKRQVVRRRLEYFTRIATNMNFT